MELLRFVAAPAAIAVCLASASAAITPQLRLVALSGQSAPGTNSRFSQLGPADFDGAPAIGGDSTMAFAAILVDGTSGFWLDRGSGPELLAHSTVQAPGTGPGVVFSQRISEATIFTPPVLVPGHTVLFNTVSGPGVGFNNDEGVWSTTTSGLALEVREGDQAPGLSNIQFGTMALRALDAMGRAIVSSQLSGSVVTENNESIWRIAPAAAPELLAREGSAAPGTGVGVVFAATVTPSAFPIIIGNAQGDLLFQGNLQGPGTSDGNDEALFLRDAAGTRLFLREGDAVPGMPGFAFRSGPTIGLQFSDLSLNVNGRIAATARVSDGTRNIGVLLSDAGGALAPLVRSGDPAPGASGTFDLLTSPIMNAHGDVAFLGSNNAGAPQPLLGVWVRSGGTLRAVALPDQPVPGQPGTVFQNIRIIDGFNDAGFLLFSADLTMPGGASGTGLFLAGPGGDIGAFARTGDTITLAPGDTRAITEIIVRRGALSDDAHVAFGVRLGTFAGAEIVGSISQAPACYANCDQSSVPPILNANDFQCFLNLFAAGDPRANCDGSTAPPQLNANDFQCFLNAFAAGCP